MNTRMTGITVAALLAWQLAAPVPLRAQDVEDAGPADEHARQEEIYHRAQARRGYVVDRTLEAYSDMLPDEFDRALASLGERDRWLDVGAGQGQAMLDYYAKQRGKQAACVAVSIEDRRTPRWHNSAAAHATGKLQYRHGKRLREYSPEELGRFQLITDVMGGFSYAADLSRFMQTVMQLLEVNGSFFTVLQDVEIANGTNKPWYDGSPFATGIETADGKPVPVCAWLRGITCAEVRCEPVLDQRPPREEYHVRKVCNDVSVPALVPVDFQAGTPPQRGYRLQGRK